MSNTITHSYSISTHLNDPSNLHFPSRKPHYPLSNQLDSNSSNIQTNIQSGNHYPSYQQPSSNSSSEMDTSHILHERLILQKTKQSSITHVKNLNCWGKGLSDVEILRFMPYIQILSLSVNKISNLKPFSGLQDLRYDIESL